MKGLNISLVLLAIMSAAPVYADCPPASLIQEANGKYTAQGLGGVWLASDIPDSGISLAAVQGANLIGARGTGPRRIMLSRDDVEEFPNIAYKIACKYKTMGGLDFYLASPEGKKYKVINPPWGYAEDTKYYGQLNYSCNAGSGCTFGQHE